MKNNLFEKIFTFLGSINLIVFLYFLFFGNHGGIFLSDIPNLIGEWIFFYCPILFTSVCSVAFLIEYFKNKRKNWYWFFILILSYLPIVIWMSASFHLPHH